MYIDIIVPNKVRNLMCVGNSPTLSLSLTWEKPDFQGSGVVGYMVKAQRVEQRPSREPVSVPLLPVYDKELGETQAQVTQGLRMSMLLE